MSEVLAVIVPEGIAPQRLTAEELAGNVAVHVADLSLPPEDTSKPPRPIYEEQ